MTANSRQRFKSLDALRGLAAIIVVLHHYLPPDIGLGGYMAVDFFLVLSGFVLAHSYLYREEQVGIPAFVLRRFARLWPLHVFSLFVMWGAIYYPAYGVFFANENCNWSTLFQHLTLTHNIGLPPTGPNVWHWNIPAWSISVEFWVNVLFILFIRKQTRSWLMVLVAAVGIGLLAWNKENLDTYNENFFGWMNSGMLRGIASFLLGIVAYRGFRYWREREFSLALATSVEVALLVGTGFFLFCSSLGLPRVEFAAPWFFTVAVIVFSLEAGLISRWLKPIDHLGTISYSVYLNHIGVLMLVNLPLIRPWIPTGWLIPIALAVVLIYSHFTYVLIEKPCQRGILRLFSRPQS